MGSDTLNEKPLDITRINSDKSYEKPPDMNYTNSDSASHKSQKDSDIALETGSSCNKYNDQGTCGNDEAKVCKNIGNLQEKPITEVEEPVDNNDNILDKNNNSCEKPPDMNYTNSDSASHKSQKDSDI